MKNWGDHILITNNSTLLLWLKMSLRKLKKRKEKAFFHCLVSKEEATLYFYVCKIDWNKLFKMKRKDIKDSKMYTSSWAGTSGYLKHRFLTRFSRIRFNNLNFLYIDFERFVDHWTFMNLVACIVSLSLNI